MNDFNLSRRNLLKSTGIGLLGFAGLSTTTSPAAGHESIEPTATDLLGPIQVPASSEDGFNYPYYLYVPESNQNEPVPLLVEPNNTGTATDDFEEHRTAAKKLTKGRLGWTRKYSEALAAPLLVPVFPRPFSEPVDSLHYVHALDETTMNLDSGELNRVDRQLIRMIEHAQKLLGEMSYPVADEVMLNGFSASGNFVNRFTALQPDIVRSVTAGGVNGTLLLPLEQAEGYTLDYQIGIADIESVTGEKFARDSWVGVPQFIYMGGEDENDTIPYDDAWSEEQRQIALDVYGEHMQNDRMPYCESVYDNAGANARFEIYEGVGHKTPVEIQRDIVDFHKRKAELKEISFTEFPVAGDASVTVHVALFDEQAAFDLRVRSDTRGDITDTATTVNTGGAVETSITLSTGIEDEEEISAIVVPTGTTNPVQSVATVTQMATETPTIEVTNQPTITNQTVTVEYAVSASYETGSAIHMYLKTASSNTKQLLGTFSPGGTGGDTYDIDPAELDAPIEIGTELQVELVDIDISEQLAMDTVVVKEESQTDSDVSADITLETQPTEGDEEIEIAYAVDSTYEPERFVTLQLGIGEEQDALLGAFEPGESATETFSLEKIPMDAGDIVEANLVDQQPIGQDRTVAVGDTDDAVDIYFTEQPTEDDPTATVQYRIDEGYQLQDVLTLRTYVDGLPGTVPGNSLMLLSAGDSGTETVTVGDAVESVSEEWRVAIVDDEPLALASTDDPVRIQADETVTGTVQSSTDVDEFELIVDQSDGTTVEFEKESRALTRLTAASENSAIELGGDGSEGVKQFSGTISIEESGTLSVEVDTRDEEATGQEYRFIVDGKLESELPPVVGDRPPQDLTGDGLHRDIDGNGEFDIFDVQALVEELDSDAVQDNPGAFNFAQEKSPTEVTIFDVQALFGELQQ